MWSAHPPLAASPLARSGSGSPPNRRPRRSPTTSTGTSTWASPRDPLRVPDAAEDGPGTRDERGLAVHAADRVSLDLLPAQRAHAAVIGSRRGDVGQTVLASHGRRLYLFLAVRTGPCLRLRIRHPILLPVLRPCGQSWSWRIQRSVSAATNAVAMTGALTPPRMSTCLYSLVVVKVVASWAVESTDSSNPPWNQSLHRTRGSPRPATKHYWAASGLPNCLPTRFLCSRCLPTLLGCSRRFDREKCVREMRRMPVVALRRNSDRPRDVSRGGLLSALYSDGTPYRYPVYVGDLYVSPARA